MSLSFPVCPLLLWMAPSHVHFRIVFLIRIVLSTTPGSVSLVHGLTHDKSVPFLFSTPHTRSLKQTEILSTC